MSAEPALHVEVEGHGPVVVLGHGFAGSARNLGPQARALRDRFTVVRYDARGHARSEAPDDPAAYTLEAFVADLGRVLDQVGAAEAVVGGLSMGALVALHFALAHPARVRALVLAAFPSRASAGGISMVARRFADAIEARGLEAAGAEFVWGPDAGLGPRAANLVRQGFLEHKPRALAHTLRGVLADQPVVEKMAPALGTLRQPALVVVGDRDRGSRGPSEALVAGLRRARLLVVPGAGHIVNLEQPATFNRMLGEFLDGLP